MKRPRTCASAQLNTGVSKCQPEWGKMKGAILVEPGTKLPKELTSDKLEELVHADRPGRVYGIVTFCEFAPNGGEVQTGAIGYGPEKPTGISALKHAFTLDDYYPELDSALLRTMKKEWGAYFFDDTYKLYGTDDGSDTLAPYNMASVYSDSTPFATSSADATMTVTFCHRDAKDSKIRHDYIELGFNPLDMTLGLTLVKLVEAEDTNEYRLLEVKGGFDRTPEFGQLFVTAGKDILDGVTTAVTYNVDKGTLTIAASANTMPTLKAPSVLYEKGIKGIEQG